MVITTSAPTAYALSGDHARIEYSTTGVVGRPSLVYKAGEKELRFEGQEIRVLDSEFGKLVTVTVGPGDAGDTTLTLIVPSITVTRKEPKTTVDTKAVLMALRRQGPVHQHYKVLNLHGIAELIDF